MRATHPILWALPLTLGACATPPLGSAASRDKALEAFSGRPDPSAQTTPTTGQRPGSTSGNLNAAAPQTPGAAGGALRGQAPTTPVLVRDDGSLAEGVVPALANAPAPEGQMVPGQMGGLWEVSFTFPDKDLVRLRELWTVKDDGKAVTATRRNDPSFNLALNFLKPTSYSGTWTLAKQGDWVVLGSSPKVALLPNGLNRFVYLGGSGGVVDAVRLQKEPIWKPLAEGASVPPALVLRLSPERMAQAKALGDRLQGSGGTLIERAPDAPGSALDGQAARDRAASAFESLLKPTGGTLGSAAADQAARDRAASAASGALGGG